MNKIALVVHGGAGNIPDERLEECREGIRKALAGGWFVLERGGSALDAVERAVVELENWPAFNAGIGAHLNREGRAELDAVLMDGRTLEAGAVAAVERIRNPVLLARLVMERSPHILLVGPGAELFALEQGAPTCAPESLVTERQRERWAKWKEALRSPQTEPEGGTVGAVAIDMHGNLAAATSTGGLLGKHPGRVGDSPLVGCGCYADNASGAVSATGEGEAIIRVVLAKAALDLVAGGSDPQSAAERALGRMLQRASGRGGLILIDRNGRVGTAHTTLRMSAGYRTTDSDEWIVLI